MNPQAIQDSYNVFVSQGYTKSIDDFKSLISSNPEALEDSYNEFVKNGYGKSIDEYKTLMGVGASPEVTMDDIKKKSLSDTTGLQQDDTSSVSPLPAKSSPVQPPITPFAGFTPEAKANIQPAGQRYMQQPSGNMYGIDKDKQFDKATSSQADFDNSSEAINKDLVNNKEENLAPKLKYLFGNYGFDFNETGLGDNIEVTAPNGKIKTISVNNFTDQGNTESSDELKQFINENKPKLVKMNDEYTGYLKKFNTQQEVDNSIKSLNDFSVSINDQQKELVLANAALDKNPSDPNYTQAKAELNKKAQELAAQESTIPIKQQQLNRSVGKYTAMKAEQGTFLGAVRNTILKDIGEAQSATVDLFNLAATKLIPIEYQMDPKEYQQEFVNKAHADGIDVPSNMTSAQFDKWKDSIDSDKTDSINNDILNNNRKQLKQDVTKPVAEGLAKQGGGSTTKEYIDELNKNIVSKNALGVAGMAPVIASSIAGGAEAAPLVALQFFQQGYSGAMKEMDESDNFKDISEGEKFMVAAPIGIVNGVLAEMGVRNIVGNSGVVKDIALDALKRVGVNTSAETFKNYVENEVESRIARGALTAAGNAATGAAMGAEIKAGELATKEIYNQVKGKKMFNTPDSMTGYVREVGQSAADMAVGAAIMSVPHTLSAAYIDNNYNGVTDKDVATFDIMSNDPNFRKAFTVGLKYDVNSGKITPEQAQQKLDAVNKTTSIFTSMPEDLSTPQQRQSLSLLTERTKLQDAIDGKDEALVQPQKERIKAINETLGKIADGSMQGPKEDIAPLELPTDEEITKTPAQQEADQIEQTLKTNENETAEIRERGTFPTGSEQNSEGRTQQESSVSDNGGSGSQEVRENEDAGNGESRPEEITAKQAAKDQVLESLNNIAKTFANLKNITPEEKSQLFEEGKRAVEGLVKLGYHTVSEAVQTVVDHLKSITGLSDDELKEFTDTASDGIKPKSDEDVYSKIVQDARAKGFSEDGIKEFLSRKGLDDDAINKALATEGASKDTSMNETFNEGYNRMMREVDGIIEKGLNRGTPQEKVLQNVIDYAQKSKVYENATDIQREQLIRDIRKAFGEKEKSAPSVDRILGTPEDLVTMTAKEARAINIKALIRGAKDTKSAIKRASDLLSREVKEWVQQGKITANQSANIISKLSKTNVLSYTHVKRFLDYIAKVYNDADYASKLKEAKSMRGDIRKMSTKKVDKNADLRDVGKAFSKIDPSMVDNIEKYNEMAAALHEGIKGSTIKEVAKGNFAEPVDIAKASEYIEQAMSAQDEKLHQERIEEIRDLMDVDASDMSEEEIDSMINGTEPINKYKSTIIHDAIQKAFDTYSSIINHILSNGTDPFTGEEVEYSKSDKELIRKFMNMDVDLLTPKEGISSVDALINFLQNRSTAGMGSVVADYKGKENVRDIIAKKIIARKVSKYFSPLVGRVLAEQVTSLPLIFEKMFPGIKRAEYVRKAMGLTNLMDQVSKAKTKANTIVNGYVNDFFKTNPNGEAFNTQANNVERGMVAFMMRSVMGGEEKVKRDFDNRKALIDKSILELSKGNEKEQNIADTYQAIYDKILKDSNNSSEVMSKADAINVDAVKHWQQHWADNYDQMYDVSKQIYNTTLSRDLNYTPDRFTLLSKDRSNNDFADNESAFLKNSGTPLIKKKSGALMEVVEDRSDLPVNKDTKKTSRYVDLSFDKNMSNSMYDALMDIHTASPIREVQSFLNSPDFNKIFPNPDDADMIRGNKQKGQMGRVELFVNNVRKKTPYNNDEFANALRKMDQLATISTGMALGGLMHPVKKGVSIALNTLINAGSLDLSAGMDPSKLLFMLNSGRGIANRGVESSAEIQSLNKMIDEAAKSTGEKLANSILDMNKYMLKKFVVNPDLYIARSSWMAYYEQSLKNQGIDTNGIDYSKHEINEEAADHAENMVNRQQNISDHDLAGKLFVNKEAAAKVFVKTALTFASFRINQSARLGADLVALQDKSISDEDRKLAIKSVLGYAVESASFKIIASAASIAIGSMTLNLMGKKESDEEFKKRVSNSLKGVRTAGLTDAVSPLPVTDWIVQDGAKLITDKLEKITSLPLSTYGSKKKDAAEAMGVYGVSVQRASELIDVIRLATTGKYVDEYGKEKSISKDDQSVLGKFVPVAVLSAVGVVPPEFNQTVQDAVKYAKKGEQKTDEQIKDSEERKEQREKTKQEKIDAFQQVIDNSDDDDIKDVAQKKIDELNADKEEKKVIKKEHAEERKRKNELLTDPDTGEKYDNEADLKRYNHALWNENFGKGSDWALDHADEESADKQERKDLQKEKDEENDYFSEKKKGHKKTK